jgi:hypothetical protein
MLSLFVPVELCVSLACSRQDQPTDAVGQFHLAGVDEQGHWHAEYREHSFACTEGFHWISSTTAINTLTILQLVALLRDLLFRLPAPGDSRGGAALTKTGKYRSLGEPALPYFDLCVWQRSESASG